MTWKVSKGHKTPTQHNYEQTSGFFEWSVKTDYKYWKNRRRKRFIILWIFEWQAWLNIWTASSEFGTYCLCEQRRFRRACASAQSRQILHCSLIRTSVKPTYGVNYVLKSPPYAEIQDQRRPPYFQYSVLYAQTQTPRRPLQWQNPAHVSISPACLWRNCVCACARPRLAVRNLLLLDELYWTANYPCPAGA